MVDFGGVASHRDGAPEPALVAATTGASPTGRSDRFRCLDNDPPAVQSVSGESSATFVDALEALSRVLADLDTPSMIIGGVAVIASGVPRSTVDIDATILALGLEPDRILEVAETHGVGSRIDDVAGFARLHQVVLLEHKASGVPIDLTLASLPFEERAIRLSSEVSYAGVVIRIPKPDDLLVYKLVAARPRDLEDAEKLLLIYGSRLDLDRIRATIREFADALGDPERLKTWDDLVTRTR